MAIERLLIANRGEIAIRVMRAAAELGIQTVAIYPDDAAASLHTRKADEAIRIEGAGAAAYLDAAQVVGVAVEAGCDAVHPGYGFLSESADFARAVEEGGLDLRRADAGDAVALRRQDRGPRSGRACRVPVVPGVSHAVTLEEARTFLEALPAGRPMLIKAVSGGGGRGMRIVDDPADLEAAYERCQSEAQAAFGSGEVYHRGADAPRWLRQI